MCLSIPGKLIEKSEADGILLGKVQFGGIVKGVCMDLLPEANVGEYVLVHVGYAITQIDAAEARQNYEYMEMAGMLEGELAGFPDDARPPKIDSEKIPHSGEAMPRDGESS